ncbi:MAG: DUF2058 domain-containing protein [Thiomargarita sp.]|nr:DUF2058 domain-containing protein [Thiomargarita sp.]
MSNSLRDQLLKQGLVSQEKAKKAEQQAKSKYHQNRKKKKKDREKNVLEKDSVANSAAESRDSEILRAQELNRQKEEARQQKALQAQVRDFIIHHQVTDPKANIPYNFVEDKFVRYIQINSTQQKQLADGYLAITVLGESYALVPAPIAKKIMERSPKTVIYFNQKEDKINDDDDPYADYQVPDDLMW